MLGCVVDYLGFRAFVMVVPPVDEEHTLVLGRLSVGTPFVKKSSVLSSMVKRAVGHLNLKVHNVVVRDESGVATALAIPTPVNLQGHLCSDNRFYVTELGKLFPADSPAPGSTEYAVKCLRPELVTKYSRPLSSDAFCRSALCTLWGGGGLFCVLVLFIGGANSRWLAVRVSVVFVA